MPLQPVLIAGRWQASNSTGSFRADNPVTQQPLPEEYPISSWADCDAALASAAAAAEIMRQMPGEQIAAFLETYAADIESRAGELTATAHSETAYPITPRLKDVELPRTTGQLRQAAAAAREASWKMSTIDTKLNIRSCYAAIGPVCVFGPNNFPFAFGSVSGGDFAAAITAGNPVIGKANPSHPGTTRLFAEIALVAAQKAGLPDGAIQLIYHTSYEDGERLVADPRVGATGFTGSRGAGLKLKAAADAAGKPIYLELSSVNPVVILPGALRERGEKISEEFATSCLMGSGQMCTNPGLLVLLKSTESEQFLSEAAKRFQQSPVGTLLSGGVASGLEKSVRVLQQAGAEPIVGGTLGGGSGHSFANTLLRTSAARFLEDPERLQTEAFGSVSLAVVAKDAAQARKVIEHLDGNLTGSIYSSSKGDDEDIYQQVETPLRRRVGRLLNDKMPTGVAVSPAMNHGGPYPATGHAGFTAVGIPAAIHRFAVLECYDNVRQNRLPAVLRDKNPTGRTWRMIDGVWSQDDVGAS